MRVYAIPDPHNEHKWKVSKVTGEAAVGSPGGQVYFRSNA